MNFINVYGVEILVMDGCVGMVVVILNEDIDVLDMDSFLDYVKENLFVYVCLVFFCIKKELDVMGIMKMVKGDLCKEVYDVG